MAEIKKINTDLQLEGRLLDGNGSAGTSGQVLSSTGTATDWVSLSEISGVDGTGTANYLAKWSDGDSITNSVIYDDGTNVGIGVTPKTGGSTWQHIQFGGTGNIIGRISDSTVDAMFANNYYINSSNVDSHIITGAATRMYLNDGEIRFDTAPSAAADAAATFTNRLFIANTGNVGIGTTSPAAAAKLDVAGNVHIRTNGVLFTDTIAGYSAGVVSLSASTNFIVPSGNVGIGTTSPSDGDLTINTPRLHVVGLQTSGAYHLAARFQAGNDSDNTGASILINHSNDRGLLIKAGRKDGDREVAYFDLVSSGGNITNMLTMGKFSSNYNVGIGTTTPTSGLDVVGNARLGPDSEHAFQVTDDSANNFLVLSSTQRTTASAARDIKFRSYGTDATDNVLVMDMSNGNVGIGTTSPNSKLEVNVGTDQNVAINSHNSVARISSYNDAFNASMPLKINGSDLRFDINSSEKMRIDSSGDVGINETNPSQKLHVNGNARVTGFYYDSNNSAGTPGYVLSSTSGGTAWVTADSVISYKWYAVSDGGLASASISNSTSLDFQGGTGISTSTSGSGSAYTIEFTNTDRGSAQNIFKNVAGPTGQPTIVAASNNDTVTLKDDRFITITTNNSTKTAQFSPKALEVCDFLLAFKSPSAQTNYLVWVNGSYQSTTGLETYKTALYAGEIDVVKIISDVTVSGVYIDVYETGAPTTPIWSSGSTNLTANTLMSFSPSGATFSSSDQLYATIAIPTSATVVYRLDFGLLYS